MKKSSIFSLFAAASFSAIFSANVQAAEKMIDGIAAVVNDDIVLRSELADAVKTIVLQFQQQAGRLPPQDVLNKQMLERLIVQRLQLQRAEHLGIEVTEERMSLAMRTIAEQNDMSLSDFVEAARQEGIDYPTIRENIRKELLAGELRQREVERRITISEAELKEAIEEQKRLGASDTEYLLRHILISVPDGASPDLIEERRAKSERLLRELRDGADFTQTAIAQSDGQRALEGGSLGWRKLPQIPSLFVDAVRDMKAGSISSLIRSPSGFHIIHAEDVRGLGSLRADEVRARHVLIQGDGAEEKIRGLYRQFRQGADFESLAREHSQDPGSASSGGDLGWSKPGTFVPAFEAALKSLGPGETSEPFRSQFGWHFLQVTARRALDNPDAAVEQIARQSLWQRKVAEETELWLRRMRDEAYVDYRI